MIATTAPDTTIALADAGWTIQGRTGETRKALMMPGVIYTFTKDLGFLGEFWADRKPGQHFVVTETGPDAQTIGSRNLITGRRSGLMLDDAWLNFVRIMGFMP
jgi:hypothetical protein